MEPSNPFSLAGRTALVAGASRGIGLAIAQHMARAGARTLLAARSLDALTAHAAELREAGFEAEAIRFDVTSPESIAELDRSSGEVDIFVAVSGANLRRPFPSYTPEEYDRIMQTNMHGFFHLTQRIGRRMVERGRGGKIITIGSLTSLIGLPYLTVYAMTKSALAGLTRTLAAEWGRYDIQVNCIAPGFILTDLNRDMWQPEAMKQWLRGAQANPRTGTPDDVAPLAVFLASAASNYITGQVIAVDGGYTTTAVWPFEPAP